MIYGNPQDQLARAGWSHDRTVSVEADVAALRTGGYPIWDALLSFLAEFSGLVIESVQHPDNPLWINAQQAVEETLPQWVELYVERSGTPLAPVGGHSHMTVYLGQDGTFYGSYDFGFGRLGRTVPEVVDGTLNDPHPPPFDLPLEPGVD